MTIGGNNPIPSQVGGGPTRFELALKALKNVVGKGGSGQSDEEIEAYWRRSRALGLVAIHQDEAAALQMFPHLATDLISAHEEILGTFPAPEESDQERREENVGRWIRTGNVADPRLREALLAIDSRLDLQFPTLEDSSTTMHGRTIGQPLEPFNLAVPTTVGTSYPNYSTGYFAWVLFDLGGAAPNESEKRIVEEVKQLLTELLPAWVAFAFIYDPGEFILDTSLLDVTGFGS